MNSLLRHPDPEAEARALADEVCAWLREATGICLPPYRRDVLLDVVERVGGGDGLAGGLERLRAGDDEARDRVFDAISIPESYLFRHARQFWMLRDLAEQRHAEGKGLHVLCAGCASGEEAWSAAAILANVYGLGSERFRITGWDISRLCVARAQTARYTRWSARRGLHGYDRWFSVDAQSVYVAGGLRRNVRFEQRNLLDPLPQGRMFDVIFFRNVSIYWDLEVAAGVMEHLVACLNPDGMLLPGPSDPLPARHPGWQRRYVDQVPVILPRATPAAARAQLARPGPLKPATPVVRADGGATPERPPAQRGCGSPGAGGRMPAAPQALPAEAPLAPSLLEATPLELGMIQRLADEGRYAEALSLLRRNHTRHGEPESLLWEGILSLNLHACAEACRVLRQAVFLRPETLMYRRWYAIALESAGLLDMAARERRTIAEQEGRGDGL